MFITTPVLTSIIYCSCLLSNVCFGHLFKNQLTLDACIGFWVLSSILVVHALEFMAGHCLQQLSSRI
jgi:hypothetical protein